jgi:hypothetical protein
MGMTDAQITALVQKRLVGINESSARVLPADRWIKQILHLFVDTPAAESAVLRIVPTLDAARRADTAAGLFTAIPTRRSEANAHEQHHQHHPQRRGRAVGCDGTTSRGWRR